MYFSKICIFAYWNGVKTRNNYIGWFHCFSTYNIIRTQLFLFVIFNIIKRVKIDEIINDYYLCTDTYELYIL